MGTNREVNENCLLRIFVTIANPNGFPESPHRASKLELAYERGSHACGQWHSLTSLPTRNLTYSENARNMYLRRAHHIVPIEQ